MKFLYQESTLEIVVDDSAITILSVENRRIFRRLLYELGVQCDGESGPWILNYNSAAIDIEKNCHFIMNPLDVDVNGKSILAKLQTQLVKEANLMTVELMDIMNRLHAFFYSLEFGYPFAIRHKDEIGVADLIKVGAFNFELERKGDVADLINYLEVVQFLLSPKVFILVNLDLLLDSDELNQLFKTLVSKQFTVLCITVGKIDELNLEKSLINGYILDKDFCLI